MKTFFMQISDIQPSQLYIAKDKLESVMKWLAGQVNVEYDAIPVKELDGIVIYTDGHTRAFALSQLGNKELKVYWDMDVLSWKAYQICVDWCIESSITSISDLHDRVVDKEDYDVLWLERCAEMHKKIGI